jgi:peptide/nickel transport system substrate-binding protein
MKISLLFKIFIIIAGIIVPLYGCKSKTSNNEMSKENTIVVGWSKGVLTFDPACADGFESAEVVSHIYEGLIAIDLDTRRPIPHLATEWKSYNGGLIWDFTIRKGVIFHDGTPLTAKSVVFSFQRQLDAVTASKNGKSIPGTCAFNYWASYFDMIKTIKAVDKYKVRFKLKYAYSPFINSLELFASYIVKPFDPLKPNTRDKDPIGTGPFKFSLETKSRTIIERFDDYWKKSSIPSYKYLVFETIPDLHQRFLSLKGGNLDICHHLDPNKFLLMNLHPYLGIKEIKSVNITYAALNTSKPPFSIRQNRIAANHVLNRDKIVKLVYQGTAETGNIPFPSFLTIGGEAVYEKNSLINNWYKHDKEKAIELFKEGGYLNGKRKKDLQLYVIRSPRGTLPKPILMANLIKKDFKKIGINVVIHALPYHDFKVAVLLGKHDIALHAWIGDMWDPDNFMFGLLHSSTGTNYAMFNNKEYDKYVKIGRASLKNADRIIAYRKALEIYKNEAPWIPLAYSKLIIGHSKRISNIRHSSSTTSRSELLTIEEQ